MQNWPSFVVGPCEILLVDFGTKPEVVKVERKLHHVWVTEFDVLAIELVKILIRLSLHEGVSKVQNAQYKFTFIFFSQTSKKKGALSEISPSHGGATD